MKLQVRKADEELVVILPNDVVVRLGWSPGDLLEAEIIGDALNLVRIEKKYDRAMRIADEVMEEYRTTFEQLAKS
jgi:antitoxin component of MazEF toxin-antitoxin module